EKDWPGNGPNTCVVNGKESNKCKYSAGDLAQHRNFYYPEFDAKLTDYTPWMHEVPGLSLVTPDDFRFRFAWWGFYDGLYDYLNGPWNFNRRNLKARESESDNINKESFTFNDQNKNARHIYARRNRINELYLDYKKGPLFLRAGRQSLSWGESDDIVFMDRLNEFDLTLGAPGLYQDLGQHPVGRAPDRRGRARLHCTGLVRPRVPGSADPAPHGRSARLRRGLQGHQPLQVDTLDHDRRPRLQDPDLPQQPHEQADPQE